MMLLACACLLQDFLLWPSCLEHMICHQTIGVVHYLYITSPVDWGNKHNQNAVELAKCYKLNNYLISEIRSSVTM